MQNFFYNHLGAQGVVAYLYDSSKRVGVFFRCLRSVKLLGVAMG